MSKALSNLVGMFSKHRLPAQVARIAHEVQTGDEDTAYKPIEWPLVRRLLTVLAPYKYRYAAGVGLGVVMIMLQMSGPKFFEHTINYITDYSAGRLGTRPDESQAI